MKIFYQLNQYVLEKQPSLESQQMLAMPWFVVYTSLLEYDCKWSENWVKVAQFSSLKTGLKCTQLAISKLVSLLTVWLSMWHSLFACFFLHNFSGSIIPTQTLVGITPPPPPPPITFSSFSLSFINCSILSDGLIGSDFHLQLLLL